MYNVLVVDDKEVFRRQIKRMPYFQERVFNLAYEAQNGLEALDILKKNRVDVVLADIRMPFIDGIGLLKKIHADNLCRCVILLSEFADFSYAREGILNGAFDYLLKPVDDDKIREAFDRAAGFLDSINDQKSPEDIELEVIANYMLEGNTAGVRTYINNVLNAIQTLPLERDQAVTSMRRVLESLEELLIEKRPYLEHYLYLPADITGAGQRRELIACFRAFSDQIMNMAAKVQRLSVPQADAKAASACEMILSEPDGPVSIHDIAEKLYVNSNYLSSLIKKATGQNTARYIAFVKTERAKKLLSDPDLRISEIAARLGYDDTEYFSKIFKKETMMSPRDFRKRKETDERTETSARSRE